MSATVSPLLAAPAASFASDAERLTAVRRRDPRADAVFVYAVRTTGVYCRPSCASRPARAENISFHEGSAAAERAGFRPCKRCHPAGTSRAEQQVDLVARACRSIEDAETPPTLAMLADKAGLSSFHFHRLFRAATGVTPKAYAAAHRAGRLAESLRARHSVTEALYEAGFGAPSRLYAAAPGRLGMSPSAFRKGGEGALIRFALGECSLGTVLVAATVRGVCAILLGEDPGALLADLQRRFPRAELIGGDAGFEKTVALAVGLVEAPGRGAAAALPLDIGGTAFQQRVWDALRAIPSGQTRSYAEVAASIGQPAAVRAVAQACAANPLAVAIPCHRVVRTDGDPSGYRWGIDRKRALLAREAALLAREVAARRTAPPKPSTLP